ncbi:aminotransferase class I/II-fold pyridoxal phosphate-dependent enzyme, partial [Pantoea agglomerans]|uniref:aminotransferase class I/II-fold pyridoxal phosphate-dependent enzyme n=1 Tax=Enterobacter agglomerans TaxID=549 RepID=UPI002B1E1600
MKEENVKLFLLCNPQNPGGRCFTKEELVELAKLCGKYQIPIVSDEIHADLVMKNHKHVPM